MIFLLRLLPAVLASLLALPVFAAFTDNGDGTVTDSVTGLMWDKCSRGQTWGNGTPPAGKPAWWADAAGRFWLKNTDGSMQAFDVE